MLCKGKRRLLNPTVTNNGGHIVLYFLCGTVNAARVISLLNIITLLLISLLLFSCHVEILGAVQHSQTFSYRIGLFFFFKVTQIRLQLCFTEIAPYWLKKFFLELNSLHRKQQRMLASFRYFNEPENFITCKEHPRNDPTQPHPSANEENEV